MNIAWLGNNIYQYEELLDIDSGVKVGQKSFRG